MTHVEAPARLHFGLLSVPIQGQAENSRRQFGGVGLMIDAPKVVLEARFAAKWAASGRNAGRALAFAQQFSATLPFEHQPIFEIHVEQCPEQHAGLGSGTALALAVAKALACEIGHSDWPAVELAKRVGRGARSAIGVHGFQHGGFIVEAGKRPGECLAPLVGHYEFPPEWRIVLVHPRVESRWHGLRERDAFTRLGRNNPTDELCRLVVTGLIPALGSKDLNGFGEALHEFNAKAGEAFANEQGGIYAGPAVAEVIEFLRKQGVRGVGQSSWGPTVFAIVQDEEAASTIIDRVRAHAGVLMAASQMVGACSGVVTA